MQAIILDTYGNYIRDITGNFNNGVLKWKDDKILGLFGGIEKQTGIDFKDRLPMKSGGIKSHNINVVILVFDGKEYKQKKLEGLEDRYPIISNMTFPQFKQYLDLLLDKSSLKEGIKMDSETLKTADKEKLGKADIETSFSDMTRDWKINNYVKKSMLTQPGRGLKQIAEFMLLILIAISAVSSYYITHSNATTNKPIVLALNQTLGTMQSEIRTQINLTASIAQYLKITPTLNTTLPKGP